MTVNEAIQHTYRIIGRTPLAKERSDGDLDADYSMLDSQSGSFSLDSMVRRLERAQRDVVRKAKACHVYDLVASATVSNYSGGDLISSSGIDMVRPLLGRVFYDSGGEYTRCVNRDPDKHESLEAANRSATSAYPVVVYGNGQMEVYPQDSTDVTFYYVKEPSSLSVPTSSEYDTFVTSGTDNSDTINLTERLFKPLVLHAAAQCHQALERPQIQSYYVNLFEDELRPYVYGLQTGRFDDDEVETDGS